ncbi:MAG: xylose isomerase [Blastopirellula sp.]|nr:MAG: xylose isomerase [Blastopirellula sp.]
MALLSFSEMSTYRWTFDEDVHALEAAGIPAIHIWRRKLSDFGEEKAIHLLEEVGMQVSALSWIGGFTGSDGSSYQESLADAKKTIHLAAEMKAACLVIYSGSRGGHTQNHSRKLFESALIELLPYAEEYNLPLAIEPMHVNCGGDWTFYHSLESTLQLIDQFKHPLLRFVADLYQLGHDHAVVDQLVQHVDKIALVQVADATAAPEEEQNRCLLGEGVLPIRETILALNQAGYRGYYDIELLGADVEHFKYQHLIEHSQKFFDQVLATSV